MLYVDRVRRSSFLALSLLAIVLAQALLFTSPALAEGEEDMAARGTAAARRPPGTARPRSARPWWTEAEIEVVRSPLASLEAAVDSMYTSYRFTFAGPYGTSGYEIADYEWEQIRDFIDGRGEYAWARAIPYNRRELHLQRFHLTDRRIIAELKRARRLGFRKVTFTTDLNDALDLPEGVDRLTDFAQAAYKAGNAGDAIRMLRESQDGEDTLDYNDPNYGIFSNPMTREDRRPLMHEKGVLFLTFNGNGSLGRSVGLHGTANLSIHAMRADNRAEVTRYNRMFRTVDPAVIEYDVDHLQRIQTTFAEGKGIHQIPVRAPRRIIYADGTEQQIQYTDGNHMPNDDITNRLTNSNPSYMLLSHFVGITNSRVYEAIVQWMIRNRQALIDGIADSTFIQGWAMFLRLDGFDHIRNFGGIGIGVAQHIADRTTLFAWMASIPNVDETVLDGPPIARNVWHDKTTLIEEMIERVLMTTVWTGSMNLSNNFHNSERQARFHGPASMSIFQAIKASVLQVREANPRLAIVLPLALMRLNVARMIGRSDLKFPIEMAQRLMVHMRANRFDQAMQLIREVAALPNPLRDQLPMEEIEDRLRRFRAFVDYHHQEMPHVYGHTGSVGLRKLVTIATVMGATGMSPVVARMVLWSVFWDSRDRENTEKREERVRSAWALLFPETEMPEREPRQPPGEAERGTAARMVDSMINACRENVVEAPLEFANAYNNQFI